MNRAALLAVALLAALPLPASAQATIPLERILIDLDGVPVSVAREIAAEQAKMQWKIDKGPNYKSAPQDTNGDPNKITDEKFFSGVFCPMSANTRLAIFSDDGCDVWIDGVLVLNNFKKGQHLPDLKQSFHVLTKFKPVPERMCHIRIRYANTIYNGETDIDGCTLFACGGPVAMPEVQLNADLNFDGKIDAADLKLHAKPGAYVAVNNDDDNNQGKPDVQNGKVPGEKDLKHFTIELRPANLQMGTVVLSRSNGKFRVFSNPQKGVKGPNDAAVLFSAAPADFQADAEGNGKKTFDLAKAADRKALAELIKSGLWVEGVQASDQLADSSITIAFFAPQMKKPVSSDTVAVTVVEFQRIRATVPSTQSRRKGAKPVSPTVFDNVYKNSLYYLNEPPTDKKADKGFVTPHALVLLSQAADTVALDLAFRPGSVPIKWMIVPAGDDGKLVGAAHPKFTPDAGDQSKASMGSDGSGSFYVTAFVDVDGSGTFKPGKPRILLPYVLVTLGYAKNESRLFQNFKRNIMSGLTFNFSSGDVQATLNEPEKAAVYFNGTIVCIGGGPTGQRGTDRVFAGWINNEVNQPTATAEYTGGHSGSYILATNIPKRAIDPFFKKGDPAPILLALPKLDSSRAEAGTGGVTACLSRSRVVDRSNPASGGTQFLVRAVDSPSSHFFIHHPSFPGSKLTKVTWNHHFHAYLAAWTNAGGVEGAQAAPDASDAGVRLYSLAMGFEWIIKATWKINAATGAITDGKPAPRISTGRSFVTVETFLPAKDRSIEVRPPGGIDDLVPDYEK